MKIPKTVKKRETYLHRIEPFMQKTMVKVFTGHRRAGKSYILYQLMEQISTNEKNANIIYLNKEDIEFDHIKNYNDLNHFVLSKTKNNCMNFIFLYEI
jgi:predicted AAA+ superfamily ATPase